MPSLACTLEGVLSRAKPATKGREPTDHYAIPQADGYVAKDQRHHQRHQRQRGEHEAQLTEILEDHTKSDSVPEFCCLFSHKRILSPLRQGGKRSDFGDVSPKNGEACLLVDHREAEFVASEFHSKSKFLLRQGRKRIQYHGRGLLVFDNSSCCCQSIKLNCHYGA